MRAVLAQLAPAIGDVESNVGTVVSTVDAHAGADLIAFPELYLSGYDLEAPADHSVTLDGPEVARIRAAAEKAGTAVAVGLAESASGRPFNTAVLIEPTGRVAGAYRKTHLFGAEAEVYGVGEELEPITLGERPVGVMICFDIEFPEVARTLTARGADLLLTISANPVPFGPDHELATRARALENGLYHLYVDRVGSESGLVFAGNSRAVDTWGRTISSADDKPSLLEVTVGDTSAAVDDRLEYARQLRPELYQLPAS